MLATIPFAPTLWKIISSRTGLFVLAGLALFTWHKFDKSSAVRKAVVGYVAHVELQTANGELAETQRRLVVFEIAREKLSIQLAAADEANRQAKKEIADYANRFKNPSAVVTRELHGRLRNH